MKKEEMNYEKWLEQLKKTPPVLENPDALTEDIMRAVKAAPFRNRPVRRLNFSDCLFHGRAAGRISA